MKKLSIILPCYNEAEHVRGCLESITKSWSGAKPLASDSSLEIVLVDDGSTDGTADIARRVVPDENLLKIVKNPKNLGLGPARNVGYTHITGDFWWLIDCDDRLTENALTEIFLKLRDGLDCLYVNFQSSRHKAVVQPKSRADIANCAVGVWCKIYAKHIWTNFPNYIPEDVWPHFTNADQIEGEVDFVTQPCYWYNVENPTAISRTFDHLCKPHNLLTLVTDDTLEKRALKYEWLSGIFKNLGDMLLLKHMLRHQDVLSAWWQKLQGEYSSIMVGKYVH